ncbi:MAG: cysteine rich repeat-containing protein [Elusimicrobia bacterium]|nr:cysteine rich repeat-containing protein [Elusimicrobiota bacterium]
MKKIIFTASLLFGFCLINANVYSQAEREHVKNSPNRRVGKITRRTEAGLKKACKAELNKFCKGVKSGQKKGGCLKENENKLSAACRKALKSLPSEPKGGSGNHKAGAALMKACKDDISRFCAGAESDLKKGACLKKNENKLSAGCGKTLKSLPPPDLDGASGEGVLSKQKAVAALMKACKTDISSFCKGINPGPQQGSCLMENENELSADCGKTLRSLPPPEQEDAPGEGGPDKP